MTTPPPPWHLTGRAAVLLASWRTVRLLVEYETSPVGPYLEHAIVAWTRKGPTVAFMEVTSEASRVGGRENWGFPKTLGDLEVCSPGWGLRRGGRWFRIRGIGPAVPLAMAAWTIQEKDGRRVRVPCRIRGRIQLAFRGRQLAVFLPAFELTVGHPTSV